MRSDQLSYEPEMCAALPLKPQRSASAAPSDNHHDEIHLTRPDGLQHGERLA